MKRQAVSASPICAFNVPNTSYWYVAVIAPSPSVRPVVEPRLSGRSRDRKLLPLVEQPLYELANGGLLQLGIPCHDLARGMRIPSLNLQMI